MQRLHDHMNVTNRKKELKQTTWKKLCVLYVCVVAAAATYLLSLGSSIALNNHKARRHNKTSNQFASLEKCKKKQYKNKRETF